ncbi:MAG TPA: FAD-dependent oxidoreductase [Acidiferrobacterales bacterium]
MTTRYPLVVVGGGIHGVGVAQAAAARGYRTLLLEREALAAATSRSSSKLIHGGLRYLESAQFGLVRESLRERELLLRLAPGLVRRVAFHIPVYRHSRRGPSTIRAGLSLYALLGNLGRNARFQRLTRGDWPGLDGLSPEGLRAVFRYHDAQTDDAALTRAVMRSAESLGAELACPAEFLGAERHAGGWRLRYRDRAGDRECDAAALVNAAGPWVNAVARTIAPPPPCPPIELVQGAHIVLDRRLARGAYYLEAPQDRRAVFVLPWRDRTLVGTTETPRGDTPVPAAALPEEIAYLEEVVRRYFPEWRERTEGSFAGLRVLPHGSGRIFHRPRDTVLVAEPGHGPRLVSIYGGKLTGYRATAQKVMRMLAATLPARRGSADTAELPLTPE